MNYELRITNLLLIGVLLVAAGCAEEKKPVKKKTVKPAKQTSAVEQRVITENGASVEARTPEDKDDYIRVLETRMKMASEDSRRSKTEAARCEQELSRVRADLQQQYDRLADAAKERDKAQGTAQYLQNRVETLEKQAAFYLEKWKTLEANSAEIERAMIEAASAQPAAVPVQPAEDYQPQPVVDDSAEKARVKELEKRNSVAVPSAQNPFTRRQFTSMIYNMSKDDLTSYLGQPDSIDGSVYTYKKAMTYAVDKKKPDSSVRIYIDNGKVTRCGFDN